MVQDSIFTRIIKGEIPCHKVYEDSKVIAFLDIHPIQPGHILVVTKDQVEQFTELDTEKYEYLMNISHTIAKKLQNITGCFRVTLRVEGFDVPHVHVHLVPTNNEHDSYNPDRMNIEPDHKALADMAKKLLINGEN